MTRFRGPEGLKDNQGTGRPDPLSCAKVPTAVLRQSRIRSSRYPG